MASLLHVPHVLLAFLPLVSGAMNAGVSHASDPRVAAILRRKASVEGLRWQNALPPIGTPSSPEIRQLQGESASIFDGTSSSSHGDYYECSLHKEGVSVGRILFNVAGQDDDEQGVFMLESLLGVQCLEIQHIDVDAKMRGHGGGKLLIGLMLATLDAENVEAPFVMLRHLERYDVGDGGPGLVKWYQSMGFEMANDVMPRASAGKWFHANDMVVSHADLSRTLAATGVIE